MKRFFAGIAVVCLLSVPSLAGEIPTVGAPQPSSTDIQNSPGEIPTEGSLGDIPSGGNPGDIPTMGLSAVLSVLGFLA
jgi:hypothetical protein